MSGTATHRLNIGNAFVRVPNNRLTLTTDHSHRSEVTAPKTHLSHSLPSVHSRVRRGHHSGGVPSTLTTHSAHFMSALPPHQHQSNWSSVMISLMSILLIGFHSNWSGNPSATTLMLVSANTIPTSTGYACSTDLMSHLLTSETQQLVDHYTQPVKQLENMRATLLASLGVDWTNTLVAYDEWPTSLDQLMPYQNSTGLYDPNPDRVGETYVGAFARNFTYDTECEYLYDPAYVLNLTCLKSRPDNIVEYCTLDWPNCQADVHLTAPVSHREWIATHSYYCPIYCLNPSIYDNSLSSFYFKIGNPFFASALHVYQEFKGKVNDWYWVMNDLMRYVPSLATVAAPGTVAYMADTTSYDGNPTPFSLLGLMPQYFIGGPGQNPSRQAFYGSPYIDIVTSLNMITVGVPVYTDGDEFIGITFCDIIIQSTKDLMEATQTQASPNAVSLTIDVNGALIANSQHTLDLMFCPHYCNGSTTGFNLNQAVAEANTAGFGASFGLLDSPYGFPSLFNTISSSPFSTTKSQSARLLLHGVPYHINWIGIELTNIRWYCILGLPIYELDSGAVWSVQPTTIVVTQPPIDLSLVVDATADEVNHQSEISSSQHLVSINSNGYKYVLGTHLDSLESFQISNQGVGGVSYTIKSPVPWLVIIPSIDPRTLFPPSTTDINQAYQDARKSSGNSSVIENSSASLGTVASLQYLPGIDVSNLNLTTLMQVEQNPNYFDAVTSSHQLTYSVYIDWSRADGRTTTINLLITPGDTAEIPTSSCFGTLVVPILVNYATIIQETQLSTQLQGGILSATVITVVLLLMTIGLNIWFASSIVIKSSSPVFNCLSLCGAICTQLCALLFIYPVDSHSINCQLRIWCLPISILLMMVPLFVKAARIAIIFGQKTFMVLKLTDNVLLVVVGISVVVGVLITGIHEGASPYHLQSRYHTRVLGQPTMIESDLVNHSPTLHQDTIGECSSDPIFQITMLVYIFVIHILGVFIAFYVRGVPSQFDESLHLLVACMFALIYGVLIIPIQFLLDSQPVPLGVLRAFGITIGVWVAMLAVFAPKIYLLITDKHILKQQKQASLKGTGTSGSSSSPTKRVGQQAPSSNGTGISSSMQQTETRYGSAGGKPTPTTATMNHQPKLVSTSSGIRRFSSTGGIPPTSVGICGAQQNGSSLLHGTVVTGRGGDRTPDRSSHGPMMNRLAGQRVNYQRPLPLAVNPSCLVKEISAAHETNISALSPSVEVVDASNTPISTVVTLPPILDMSTATNEIVINELLTNGSNGRRSPPRVIIHQQIELQDIETTIIH